MKKVLMMLLILTFLTGCTVVRIDTKSIDNIVGVVLSKDNTLANINGKGYKYYLPRGVVNIDSSDFNEKLYCKLSYDILWEILKSNIKKGKNIRILELREC